MRPAGIAYRGGGFGTILLGSYGNRAGVIATIVIVTALIGEGTLMSWLVFRGVREARFPGAST